jgi:hypothetical protein
MITIGLYLDLLLCHICPGSTRSQTIWIPITKDDPITPPFDPMSLDVSTWFPAGYQSIRISTLPGTTYDLANHYHLFITYDPMLSLVNATVQNLYGKPWYGNIILVKLGKVAYERVIHVSSNEGLLAHIYESLNANLRLVLLTVVSK